MKVLLAIIAWMLCTILVILPTLATPSTPPKEKLQFKTITWKIDDKEETYTTFISSLRSAFIPFGKVCEIPETPTSPKPNDAFILVDVTSTKEKKTITLAFLTSNLYFVGFKDTTTDKKGRTVTRANFVNDNIDYLKKNLFKDAQITKKLPFGENYGDLESVAEVGRLNFLLGVKSFSTYIDTIYGKDYKGVKVSDNKPKLAEPEKDIGKNLARFALTAVQIISEATRFKYIEGEVVKFGIRGSFKPDNTFVKLENSWDPFTELIRKSSPGCKPVKSPDFPWEDIKKQVGLLKHPKKGLGGDVPFMEGIFGKNADVDDVADLEFIM